jgi:hypothetical protein
VLTKIARQLRDAWAILGLSLLLIVVLENGFRCYERLPTHASPSQASGTAQPQASGAAPSQAPSAPAKDPLASEPWFPEFNEVRHLHMGRADARYVDYDPYRGWWVRPGEHKGLLVIEPSGYRHTEQSLNGDPATLRHVFLFGGSTMWGYTVRDQATIPSWVASQLATAGIHDVEVDNKAQCGFNLTQNLATLVLELRRGARPTAVVFLDGINEIGPVAEGDRPGDIYGQADARRRFALTHATTNELLLALWSNLHIVQALQRLKPAPREPEIDVPAACQAIANNYLNLVRVAEALGREFDFKPIFFWQPALATSGKPLGPWERHLMADAGGGPLVKLTKACVPDVEARLASRKGINYFPLNTIFDDVQGDQFVDQFGHVTEQASAIIAAAITRQLIPVLQGTGTEHAGGVPQHGG